MEGDEYNQYSVGSRVEISPDSWNTSRQMAAFLQRNGGSGLIIDYGQDYAQGSTVRVSEKNMLIFFFIFQLNTLTIIFRPSKSMK